MTAASPTPSARRRASGPPGTRLRRYGGGGGGGACGDTGARGPGYGAVTCATGGAQY